MEAYTNCRQFNCVTPIVEQAEYHMFCREKAELYLPEMYNKIGVGFMAWGPLSMCLGDTQNSERLWLPKGSFKTKSQSYSWTEDEVNKEVSAVCRWNCTEQDQTFPPLTRNGWRKPAAFSTKREISAHWRKNLDATQCSCRLPGRSSTNPFSACYWEQHLRNNCTKACKPCRYVCCYL